MLKQKKWIFLYLKEANALEALFTNTGLMFCADLNVPLEKRMQGDPAKTTAICSRAASFCAWLLAVDIEDENASLSNLLQYNIHALPAVARVEALSTFHQVSKAHRMVTDCEDMADMLWQAGKLNEGQNVNINSCSQSPPFFTHNSFVIYDGLQLREEQIPAIGTCLMRAVYDGAHAWVAKLDAALNVGEASAAADGQYAAMNDALMKPLCARLARAVARTVALMVSPESVAQQHCPLSTRSLERMASKPLTRILSSRPLGRAGVSLPFPPFLKVDKSVVFWAKKCAPSPCAASSLESRQQRLVSAVLNFSAIGLLRPGIVSASLLKEVTSPIVADMRRVAHSIVTSRAAQSVGLPLFLAMQRLFDRNGAYAEEVQKALCELSSFSCAELATAFDSRGRIMPTLARELSKRTRAALPGKAQPSKEYTSFACDMLLLALPHVHERRSSAGVPECSPGNPLLDIMRAIESARGWSAESGRPLQIAIASLRRAHPKTEAVMQALVKMGVVKRQKKGLPQKDCVYTFEPEHLAQALGQLRIENLHE